MSFELQPNEKSNCFSRNNLAKNKHDDNGLQESDDMTPLTEGSTTSAEEDGAGWLGGIGADFRNIANSLKDAVPPTIGAIGDIASFVQRSALSVAQEIAQLERDGSSDDDGEGGDAANSSIRLPWEILKEIDSSHSEYQEDEELKASIMALSGNHATFLKPFSVKGSSNHSAEVESNFVVLDEPRIQQIRRLLEIDENLAATHAHLSGRSDVKETVFWTNYFFNCEKARREHLERIQSASIVSSLSEEEEEETAKPVTKVKPPTPPSKSSAAPSNASVPSPSKSSSTATPAATVDESVSRSSSQNSLVPADDDSSCQEEAAEDDESSTKDDAASFVQVNKGGIASPPCSLMSVEDLVLVNKSLSKGAGGETSK